MTIKNWVSKGQREDIVKEVESVGTEPKVFWTRDGTRLEYWVLALDRKGGRVVGLRVWSVES